MQLVNDTKAAGRWSLCGYFLYGFVRKALTRHTTCPALLSMLWVMFGVSAHASSLPHELARALHDDGIPHHAVSFVVQPVGSAKPLVAHRAHQAMNPASVMKLLTSLVALEKLGPAYTWQTRVWAVGEITQRTLKGDLVIQGEGDPTLTLERLWLLQREIKARGIDTILGNLILDTRHFELPQLDPGALDGEPLAAYNALPGALLANYNATTLRLEPSENSVVITPDLDLPGLTLTSQLVVDDMPCDEWKDRLKPITYDAVGSELRFEGRYARDCGEKQLNLNVFEPAHHFDATFRALWKQSGGELSGHTVLGSAPGDRAALLSFSSLPLAEALRSLNKYSNNVMTRNLYLTLGAAHAGAPATLEKSRRAIDAWLMEKKINAPELVLENGAGLSRIERISARSLVRILQAAYASPYFSEFESALPIVAIDGTLKRRFADTPVAGRAHLKSGTLQDVRALAGYVSNRSGQRMIFVMMVNHVNAERADRAQRALLTWVHAHPPSPPQRARRSRK